MKSNLFTTILNWVLVTSLVLSIVFCVQFFFRTRELRSQTALFQQEMARLQNNRSLLSALANEVMEYSKRDQGVIPVLETIGIKPVKGASAGSTNRPAAK
jgi:hypothetical protein